MWQMPAVEAPPGLVVAWLSFSDTGRGHAYLPDRRKGYVHLVQGQEVKSFTRTSDQQTRVLPFSLSLDSFRVVYYPGTEAPSDYKSYVSYKVNGKWKEEVISMNHILSVEGYRFYQSSYDPDLSGSWLSVNYDPWGIAVTYAGYLCLAFSSLWLLGSRRETFSACYAIRYGEKRDWYGWDYALFS